VKWPPFHPEAGAEFDEAFDWYAERSGKLARRFLDSTARTIEFLRTYPEAGAPIGRHTRKFVIRPFSYSLIYLPGKDDFRSSPSLTTGGGRATGRRGFVG
jgi:plasmid stabilization system protein ParE